MATTHQFEHLKNPLAKRTSDRMRFLSLRKAALSTTLNASRNYTRALLARFTARRIRLTSGIEHRSSKFMLV